MSSTGWVQTPERLFVRDANQSIDVRTWNVLERVAECRTSQPSVTLVQIRVES
jgi:hypothetical protein